MAGSTLPGAGEGQGARSLSAFGRVNHMKHRGLTEFKDFYMFLLGFQLSRGFISCKKQGNRFFTD